MSELASDLFFIIIVLLVTAILGILTGSLIGMIKIKNQVNLLKKHIVDLEADLALSEKNKNEIVVEANAMKDNLEKQILDLGDELLSKKEQANEIGKKTDDLYMSLEKQVSELENELSSFRIEKVGLEEKASALVRALEEVKSADRQRNIEQEIASQAVKMGPRVNNLKIIEGIGPRIEQILKEEGLDSFIKLSLADPDEIRSILIRNGGSAYRVHDPRSWPQQAKLAADDKWAELKEFQDKLSGGN